MTLLDPSAMAVTVAGTPLPLAQVTSVSEALAPECDMADIVVPWGDRLIRGAAAPGEDLPALGAQVLITASDWSWRGELVARHRSAAGAARSLRLRVAGPALALDRAYLPSFARSGLSGVVQTPGGPRFAPGTRSAAADGPGSTYYLGGTDDWTVEQALASYVAHAPVVAGLPAIAIDATSADLSRVLEDIETDGGSVHARLQAILGHRLGLGWRPLLQADGTYQLRVRGLAGTGATVDLTGGDVIAYDIGEDSSAALAALEVRGATKHYVLSIDGKATGNLIGDWTSGDESDRAAGDLGSPAYRRFRLATFALPDGSPSVTAEPIPTLPISASTSLLSGSSPWLLFAQLASDSTWQSLQGRCSVSVGGGRIWIEGIDPASWASWSRIRLTLCLAPRANLSAIRTGGSGTGRGLALVGSRHVYASAAAVRVSGGSLATVTGDAVFEQDPVDDQADALWQSLSGPQLVASWSRRGLAGPAPGDRITSILLPRPGTTPTAVACDALCTNRTTAWQDGGIVRSWQIAPRPYSSGVML